MSDVGEYVQALDKEILESAVLTHRRTRRPVARHESSGALAMQAMLDSPDGSVPVTGMSKVTGGATAERYTGDTLFKTPTKLQLLEERLSANKEKYQAGSVQVGKKVETRTENVNVALSHDEVVIERPVTDARPVEGNVVLGAATDTIRVDLEAERANVSKQAYVTEEVEVGKRTETEQNTYSGTVGREVLDVTKTGEVEVTGKMTTLKLKH
jgi:uncharacterized protein (TIGR02271 family)